MTEHVQSWYEKLGLQLMNGLYAWGPCRSVKVQAKYELWTCSICIKMDFVVLVGARKQTVGSSIL